MPPIVAEGRRGPVVVYSPNRRVPAPRPAATRRTNANNPQTPIDPNVLERAIGQARQAQAQTQAEDQQKAEFAKSFWGHGFGQTIGTVIKPLSVLSVPMKAVQLGREEIAKALPDWAEMVAPLVFSTVDEEKARKDKRSNLEKLSPTSTYGGGEINMSTGNYWADSALGFASDVVFDPLTYVTGGATKLGVEAEKIGAAAATKAVAEGASEEAAQAAARAATRKLRTMVPHNAAERLQYVSERVLANPELATKFGTDIEKGLKQGLTRMSPEARQAFGDISKPGLFVRGTQARIPLSGLAGEAVAHGGAATRNALARIPAEPGTKLGMLRNLRVPEGTEELYNTLIRGQGGDLENALLTHAGRQSYRAGEGTATALGNRTLSQFFKDNIKGVGKGNVRKMLVDAETTPDINPINQMYADVLHSFEEVAGRTIDPDYLKDPAKYVPHIITPEWRRALKDAVARGDQAALDFARHNGFTSDDLLENSGFLAEARKMETGAEIKMGDHTVAIPDGTIPGLNANEDLRKAFPGFKGKFFMDDPVQIGEAYSTSLGRQAGKEYAINNLVQAASKFGKGGVVEGPLAEALKASEAARAAQDPRLAVIRGGFEPGGTLPEMERAPVIPGSAQDIADRAAYADWQAKGSVGEAPGPPRPAYEAAGIKPEEYFGGKVSKSLTTERNDLVMQEGKKLVNAVRRDTAEVETKARSFLSGIKKNLMKGLGKSLKEDAPRIKLLDERIDNATKRLAALDVQRPADHDELIQMIFESRQTQRDLEEEIAKTEKTFDALNKKTTKKVVAKMRSQLRTLKELHADAVNKMETMPARMKAEAKNRLNALEEPIRKAERTRDLKIMTVEGAVSDADYRQAQANLRIAGVNTDEYNELVEAWRVTVANKQNAIVGAQFRNGKLTTESQRAIESAAAQEAEAYKRLSVGAVDERGNRVGGQMSKARSPFHEAQARKDNIEQQLATGRKDGKAPVEPVQVFVEDTPEVPFGPQLPTGPQPTTRQALGEAGFEYRPQMGWVSDDMFRIVKQVRAYKLDEAGLTWEHLQELAEQGRRIEQVSPTRAAETFWNVEHMGGRQRWEVNSPAEGLALVQERRAEMQAAAVFRGGTRDARGRFIRDPWLPPPDAIPSMSAKEAAIDALERRLDDLEGRTTALTPAEAAEHVQLLALHESAGSMTDDEIRRALEPPTNAADDVLADAVERQQAGGEEVWAQFMDAPPPDHFVGPVRSGAEYGAYRRFLADLLEDDSILSASQRDIRKLIRDNFDDLPEEFQDFYRIRDTTVGETPAAAATTARSARRRAQRNVEQSVEDAAAELGETPIGELTPNILSEAEIAALKKERQNILRQMQRGGKLWDEKFAWEQINKRHDWDSRVAAATVEEERAIRQARAFADQVQESMIFKRTDTPPSMERIYPQVAGEQAGFGIGEERLPIEVGGPGGTGVPQPEAFQDVVLDPTTRQVIGAPPTPRTEREAITSLTHAADYPGAVRTEGGAYVNPVDEYQRRIDATYNILADPQKEAARINQAARDEAIGTLQADLAATVEDYDQVALEIQARLHEMTDETIGLQYRLSHDLKDVAPLKQKRESLTLMRDKVKAADPNRKALDLEETLSDIEEVAKANPDMLDRDLTVVESLLDQHAENLARVAKNKSTAKDIASMVERPDKLAKMTIVTLNDNLRLLHNGVVGEGSQFLDKELYRMFTNTYQLANNPTLFGRVFNVITNVWKTYATLSPGFQIRNALSGIFMNTADGVPLLTQLEGAMKWREFVKAKNPREWLAAQSDEIQQAFHAASGAGAGGRFTEAGFAQRGSSRDWWNAVMSNRTTRWAQRFGSNVEGSLRLPAALDSIRKGDSVTAAMTRVTKLHFDYGQVSKLDTYAKRIFPFWTFMSRNLPLQIEMMWTKPRAYAYYESFKRNFEQEPDPFTPQYWTRLGAWNTGLKNPLSGTSIYAQPDFGFTRVESDVKDIADFVTNERPGALLSNINPLLSAPADYLFKRDSFYNRNFDETDYRARGGIPAAPINLLANNPLGRALGITNDQGEISDNFWNMYTSLNPVVDRLNRLFPTASGGDTARTAESWQRFLGLPPYVRTLSPTLQKSEFYRQKDEATSKIKAQRAAIERMLQAAG